MVKPSKHALFNPCTYSFNAQRSLITTFLTLSLIFTRYTRYHTYISVGDEHTTVHSYTCPFRHVLVSMLALLSPTIAIISYSIAIQVLLKENT